MLSIKSNYPITSWSEQTDPTQLKDEKDSTKNVCINCGEAGHLAAYKGCPMLKMSTKLVKHMNQQK